ncbi:MAG: hydantoinase/oxoprolinase family protein [Alphaproteobacteria bacterium]|nr:hydantoinase/oxoprolinase family protein [Alphaproteobacteria bacterium]
MRFACDTGGTFTDLIVEDDAGGLHMYKAATTPADPVKGVLDALALAAADMEMSLADLLAKGDMLIHGTTHAINAIITGNTAKTAFLTTAGHPDILVLREGGRIEPFNFVAPYPEPYLPRALTFEVPERIDSAGGVHTALDEAAVIAIAEELKAQDVEAVAVCLLWSIYNSTHELRVGELLEAHLPGVPYSLSHQLNPALREYRRASSTAIDASLKPLMGRYLGGLTERLTEAGFMGRTLVLTSQGGMLDASDLAQKPIHAINSGPSMAPIAGRHYARDDSDAPNVIIADTGGTTYDVSLVRQGRIPLTKETWIGQPFRGHMTGFPSIDIKSVGAGGGSIAWVDAGGLLHVGPQSAGAVPGPVCYGSGGTEPTLTDACLTLGYVDPDYFLGGTMQLDAGAAAQVVEDKVAQPLNISVMDAAAAIVSVATENMVQAIADITVNQGIDPADSVLIGGGGAAGLNSVFIARRLGCPTLLIPETGAGLSAAGALMSDLTNEYRATFFTTSGEFDRAGVNRVLEGLRAQCQVFIDGPGSGAASNDIEYTVEARYASQVWEIEVPLANDTFTDDAQLAALVEGFHAMHEQIFAIRDPGSVIEFVGWTATARCRLRAGDGGRLGAGADRSVSGSRKVYFSGAGEAEAVLHDFETMASGVEHQGPAIIESPFTTVVADADTSFQRTAAGSLLMRP